MLIKYEDEFREAKEQEKVIEDHEDLAKKKWPTR